MNKTGRKAKYRLERTSGGSWVWELLSANGRVMIWPRCVFPTRNKAVHDINRFEAMVKSKPRLEYEG